MSDTYLRDALNAHLSRFEATFEFMLQFQAEARRMPIEDASVEWKEADSPYHAVARIRIPAQDTSVSDVACEQIAFSPWNCLAEHRPLGSMNRARRAIYAAMASLRGTDVAPSGTAADRTPS